ncbi:hypothetical protein K3495_g493 [Podosphaera aphanis]|nr:hypothetical protein K3495_g493 [Podosphaera aphanis]
MFDYQACDVGVESGKGSAKALAPGSVRLDLMGDKTRSVTSSDVFYVPELRANLLSTEKLRSKGLFYRNDRQILHTENAVISDVYVHQKAPHNLEQNGRAEVSNHLVYTFARKMMIHGKVPKGLWAEAVDAAVYIMNITPSITLGGTTPHQVLAEYFNWDPKIPYFKNFRVYGCKAFVLDHGVKRSEKFSSRALVGKLVGFEALNIYRIWLPTGHKVIRSTNVTFDENCLELNGSEENESSKINILLPEDSTFKILQQESRQNGKSSIESSLNEGTEYSCEKNERKNLVEASMNEESGDLDLIGEGEDYETHLPSLSTFHSPINEESHESRRSSRTKTQSFIGREHSEYQNRFSKKIFHSPTSQEKFTKLKRHPHRAFTALTNAIDTTEFSTPNLYKEAINSPHREEWFQAMKGELDSLNENEVWELVPEKEVDGKNIY